MSASALLGGLSAVVALGAVGANAAESGPAPVTFSQRSQAAGLPSLGGPRPDVVPVRPTPAAVVKPKAAVVVKPKAAVVVKPAKPAKEAAAPVKKPPRVVAPATASTAAATAAAKASSYLRGCDGTKGWQQRRGSYAMKRITYNWRKTGYRIVFLAARSGISGMTYPSGKRIEVYVRSCSKMTNAYLAETIAHEIGHAVDFSLGNTAWEKAWRLARHISATTPWYGAAYANDFATPAGDFAETFGAWQVPDGPNDSKWGRPSKAQLKLLIPLLNR